MAWVSFAASLVALAAVGVVLRYLWGVLQGIQEQRNIPEAAPADVRDAYGALEGVQLEGRVSLIESRLEDFTLAIAEGIQHVERAEGRIKAVVKRARAQLREGGLESPGLDIEAQELLDRDGERSEEPRLSIVPADVGGHQSTVPGVTIEQLQRARARGLS